MGLYGDEPSPAQRTEVEVGDASGPWNFPIAKRTEPSAKACPGLTLLPRIPCGSNLLWAPTLNLWSGAQSSRHLKNLTAKTKTTSEMTTRTARSTSAAPMFP